LALLEAGKQSCTSCLAAVERCAHRCCIDQFLLNGRTLGILTHDDNFWRVSPAAQERAARMSLPSPADSAQQPPQPVTWEKLQLIRFPVAFPLTAPKVRQVRVSLGRDDCGFSDLAGLVRVYETGLALRRALREWMKARATTTWLKNVWRDTKAGFAGKMDKYFETVHSLKHGLTLFDLHCLSLLLHLDVFVFTPVWDGPPQLPEQLRALHTGWDVPITWP
jgi:hypothetical protein